MKITLNELLTILFLGIVVFIIFRLYYLIVPSLVRKLSIKDFFVKLGPFAECLSWLTFIIWSIQYAIESPEIASIGTSILLFVLFLGFIWFVLRDFMSGILLRMENAISLNERLQIKEVKGMVSKIGYLSLELVNDEGQTVRIPFSAVQANIRFKDNPAKRIKAHQFELLLPKVTDIDVLIEQQKILLHSAPWSSVTKSPEIKFINETPNGYHFKIVIYTLQVAYFQKIRNYILKKNKGATLVESNEK